MRPLRRQFRGHPVLSMPPPGGGLTLLQLLGILEPFDLAATGLNSAASLHPMAEAMNLAYRDRNALLGDPDRVPVPVERLLSPVHLDGLRRRIDPQRHTPAPALEAAAATEGTNTTHLSVADRQGGLASLTTTLNFPYGNGISVPGMGFLLNNEMDDFTALPGSANAFGLRQGSANAIAPGRRPLSSMAPTLVFRPDGRPWLATGSPGGSRIITTILQVLLNRMVHGLNLAGAVAAPASTASCGPTGSMQKKASAPTAAACWRRWGTASAGPRPWGRPTASRCWRAAAAWGRWIRAGPKAWPWPNEPQPWGVDAVGAVIRLKAENARPKPNRVPMAQRLSEGHSAISIPPAPP